MRAWPLLFLLPLLLSCSNKNPAAPQIPPTPVTVYTVTPRDLPAIMNFIGIAQSSHPVEIRARVEGYLEKIFFLDGETVQAGDVLFQLDPLLFQAKLDNAKADLDAQNAILWNANTTVARLKPLYEQNAASKRDLDNAIAQQLTAEAGVSSAKAMVTEASLNLGYTTIKAPVTAMAGKSNFREGALITPGPQGLLTTLSVLDPIWVYFTMSDNDMLRYDTMQANGRLRLPKDMSFSVEIELSDGTRYPSKGNIDFADPTLNQGTGTMTIRAVFANTNKQLKPGQFAKVYVHGSTFPNALAVPQRALQEGSKGLFVYVVDKDNRAVRHEVTTGSWYENLWIIESGLAPGDRVIIDGVNKVQPGSVVHVSETLT